MSARLFQRLTLLLLLLALARHAWLATFVHPYADDLSYANICASIGLLERLDWEFTHWNGRYFSNILVLRGPMKLGPDKGLMLYRLVPIVLMGLTWLGACRLLHALFRGSVTRSHAAMGAVVFLLVYLNAMPDASEGFYWYTGAVSYQLSGALFLLLAAEWVSFLGGYRSSLGPVHWVYMALLVIIIAGCNELHAALLVAGHAALLLFGGINRRTKKSVLAFLIVALGCAAVVVLAPGNAVRGANFPEAHDILKTIFWSAAQTGRFTLIWCGTSMLGIASIWLVVRGRSIQSDQFPHWTTMNKWMALALPFATVFVAMVLPYWSTGSLGQYRTVNAALLHFMPLLYVAVIVWDVQVFRKRWPSFFIPRPSSYAALFFVLLFFVWGRDFYVTTDLITGRAAQYDHGMHDRILRIRNAANSGSVLVKVPLVIQPRSLVITPLKADADNWMNRSTAEFYGNKELFLKVAEQ